MKLNTALFAALAITPGLAESGPSAAATELDPLVVTATRTEVRESDTLATITVITREDIERAQVNDIAELLRFVSGVEVARNGGPGQLASAFIRGGGSQHTLVLLDGVRVNPTTHGAALQNISVDMIERVEVLKGPRSTLYGSDAMGGVVHIITRRHAGTGASLRSRYGSYNTRDVSGAAHYGARPGGAQLHASQLETDGFSPHSDSTMERAHRNTTLNASGDLALGDFTLGMRAWDAGGNTEYLEDPDPFCFPCAYTSPAELDFHNRAVAASVAWSPAPVWESRLLLEQTLDENEIVDGIFAPSRTRNERIQARLQNAWKAAGWTRLSLGLETARERTVAAGLLERRDIHTVYVQDEITAGSQRALLAGSLMDHEAFGTVRLWNLEYGYDFPIGLRVSLGAGTGFRAPSVIERFFPGFGNPDLRPERARSYELGVRQSFGAAHRLDLRAFRTDYEDLIGFDPSTFLAGNVNRARNDGIELAYRWQPMDRWSVRLSGLLQDPRQCTSSCDEGPALVRRAKKTATLLLAGGWRILDLSLEALAVGPRADFDSGTFASTQLPGYALVNFGVGFDLHPKWTLRAKGENLLDKDYQTVEGYNTPGRSGSLTVGYLF